MTLFGTLQEGLLSRDPTFHAIVADRDRFGEVFWLFGDSIFHGLALRRYPERWTLEEIAAEPLWPFRSPGAMINLRLKGLGLLEEDATGVALKGQRVACFAGSCGQPEKTGAAALRIKNLIEESTIRPGDKIAFLDAGPHTSDPDRYEAQWLTMRRLVTEDHDLTLLMCTAFENLAEDSRDFLGEFRREQAMYSIGWPPGSSGRSHNDATRAAALAPLEGRGKTRLIDMAKRLTAFKKMSAETCGAAVYLKDNVHLNVWGNMRLAAELMHEAWPDLVGADNTATEQLVSKEWTRLAYGARQRSGAWAGRGGWSPRAAVQQARACYESAIEAAAQTG